MRDSTKQDGDQARGPRESRGRQARRVGLWIAGLAVAAALLVTLLPAVAVLATGGMPWQSRQDRCKPMQACGWGEHADGRAAP